MPWPSFQRSRRYARRLIGARLAVYCSAALAALFVPLLIIALGLLTELFDSRGHVTVATADQAELEGWAGPPSKAATEASDYSNRGLLPLVWRMRDTQLGGWLRAEYLRWPPLQTNRNALLTLILAGWLLVMAECLTLYLLETAVQRSAVSVISLLRSELRAQAVRLGAGDLLSGERRGPLDLFTEQAERLQQGLAAWRRVMPFSIFLLILLVALALAVQAGLALAAIVLGCLSWLLLGWLHQRSSRHEKLLADRARQQTGVLVEALRQTRLSSGAAFEDKSAAAFAADARRLQAIELQRSTNGAGIGPLLLYFVLSGAVLLLLLIGINALQDPPRVGAAEIVMLMAALAWMGFPLLRIARLRWNMPGTEQAAASIFQYLDRQPAVGQLSGAKPLPRLQRDMQFDRLTLAETGGRRLLNQISLTLPAAGRVAIMASDEATPMAFAGLLPRLFDPAAGRILFDGVDIRHATLDSLRGQIGLVLPESLLSTGSIAENIACGNESLSLARITEAAKAAQVYDFIQSLPQSFDTIVGEHGMRLDVEQIVRIGIARELLRNPAIVVLDEPREESTPEASQKTDAAIQRLAQGRLLIVLARRLSTIRAMPRIMLFHEGAIFAEGTHLDLLQKSELYRHLNYVRFNEFRGKVK